MGKRADGEGQYKQRPNGSWELRYRYTAPDGKPKRLSLYGKTRTECRQKLTEAKKRIDAGAPPRDSKETVGAWLARWRTTSLPASDRKPATGEQYSNLCRKHLEGDAVLAAMPLSGVRPTDVEALVLRLKAKGLADSTVRSIYTVLRTALDTAVRDQQIAVNAAAKVRRPGVARQEAKYLTVGEVRALIANLDGLRYALAVKLMAATGMRRGEVAGLRWEDVDLEKGELVVSGTVGRVDGQLARSTPKSERSRRRIALSAAMVTALKAHRTAQKRERLAAGNLWVEHDAVFATETGTWVEGGNLLRTVRLAAAKAGLDGVKAHSLRHSAAVAMLESGAHVKLVADTLGHSSVAITGDLYGHTSDERQRDAMDGLSASLGI